MKKKPTLFVQLIIFLVLFAFLITIGACSNATLGQLSVEGEDVMSDVCSLCHGAGGVMGFAPHLNEQLGYSFENARQLYDKIRSQMPRNKPGSLASLEYRQVLSYILLNNEFANEQEVFKTGSLSKIAIPSYSP